MLHNEARELLVQGYEATHDVKGIAKAYSVSKWTVYRLGDTGEAKSFCKLKLFISGTGNRHNGLYSGKEITLHRQAQLCSICVKRAESGKKS